MTSEPGRAAPAVATSYARLPGLDRAADHFEGQPTALAVLARVAAVLAELPGVQARTSRSQVAFRRRRAFAYLWSPGRYLVRPGADVVLSVALGRRDESPRWNEVARPAAAHWMHHLEVRDVTQIDEQVARWLRAAGDRSA